MTLATNGNPAKASGAAIYVDTENLQDSAHAQGIVDQIVSNWPGPLPLDSLSLYVRADRTASWEMWAEAAYPKLRVRVRGVQHFSNNRAKNSADLAITADAIADLVTGQVAAIAVVSNDSDFGALFVKVKELARSVGVEQAPFLWITSPEAGGLSPELERFIPADLRWDLSETSEPPVAPVVESSKPNAPRLPAAEPAAALPSPVREADADSDAIAEELIRRLPIGRFKVADAQQVVKARWPKQPDVNHPARFGQYLLNTIWPILERRGVRMPRTTSPRTYEITKAAKDSLVKAGAKPAPKPAIIAEATPAQLAAVVAHGITDDLFKASDAQDAIKSRLPQHPAASYTATQFGTWFSRQLWPIMEQHGVVLAREKPRRYEMTPDSRHRLTTLA